MLEAGEDPRYIARRMIVHASEDIGLADPRALLVAAAAAQAVEYVGLPEARLNLAEAAIYLARAPKSNSVVTALGKAQEDAASTDPVPLHLKEPGHPARGSSATGRATSTRTTTRGTGSSSSTARCVSRAPATTSRPVRARSLNRPSRPKGSTRGPERPRELGDHRASARSRAAAGRAIV